MKKYYQLKGGINRGYVLRKNTYRRIWYLIADYPYFKSLQNKKLSESSQICEDSFTYNMESDKEGYMKYIAAIEAAQAKIPDMYIGYIMSHIVERKQYKNMEGICEKTLKIWMQRFIWYVAENLGEV